MAATSLKFLTVPAAAKHTATVIFIHGLGDSGHGWLPVARQLAANPALKHVKWILPHAPQMSVTANFGMEMPSWFDILSFSFDGEEDEKGLLKSSKSITELITAEQNDGVSPNRIVLGGFSQGAALSYLTGLTRDMGDNGENRLAGIVALSGWLPLRKKFEELASPHASKVPIFVGHGDQDPLVKLQFAKNSIEFLKAKLGFEEASSDPAGPPKGIQFKIYGGLVHSADIEEVLDLQKWLIKAIPSDS